LVSTERSVKKRHDRPLPGPRVRVPLPSDRP
jgi:hypothetical protein